MCFKTETGLFLRTRWNVFAALDDEVYQPSGDVQKKMIPWRNTQPDPDLLTSTLQLQDSDLHPHLRKGSRPQRGDLILVTSLIDKPTNLGGTCFLTPFLGRAVGTGGLMESVMHVSPMSFMGDQPSRLGWTFLPDTPAKWTKNNDDNDGRVKAFSHQGRWYYTRCLCV